MRYPVLRLPLEPGLVTLSDYGPSIGLTKAYIQGFWKPDEEFPEPVGELPPLGRHGGGRGQMVYDRAALDAFRIAREERRVLRSSRLVIGHSLGERVILGQFAGICGVSADPDRYPGIPAAADDGSRALGDLVAWHNALPPAAGPRLAVTALGPREMVTLTGFARLVGVHPTTVYQYRRKPGFPEPAGGDRYPLGRLADWWNSRPGKAPSDPPARTATAAARAGRALQILGDAAPAHLAAAGRLRAAHPTATLAALAQLADPPLSRDVMASRVRRLITLADQYARDQGLPGTRA